MTEHTSLIKLDEVRQTLAQLHDIDDVKAIRDKAEAVRIYSQQAKLGLESQNYAAEIKLRAERRAGEILRDMELTTPQTAYQYRSDIESQPVTRPTLNDIGVTRNQSSNWQRIANMPEERFEAVIETTKASGEELTTAAMIRAATNGRHKPKTNRAGDEYVPQGHDLCQTPPYALDPLFPYLPTNMTIWEPAAGEGLLVEALRDYGCNVVASDIQTDQNFFEYEPIMWDALVTNPPFSIKYDWLEHCYELTKPFALLMPVEVLGAASAQELFKTYGIQVIFMSPRVNFKMPNQGWDGGGAQFPTAWFCYGLHLPQDMLFERLDRGDYK